MEAKKLKSELSRRFKECQLEMHSEKTKIVNCRVKVASPPGVEKKFDFLGYQFRPRVSRSRAGELFAGFTPAISPSPAKAIRDVIRSWQLQRHTYMDIKELASRLNPTIRGWIEYYGKFNRSEFNKVLRYLDLKIVGWVKRKYRKHGSYTKKPIAWLGKVANSLPDLFAHWKFVRLPAE